MTAIGAQIRVQPTSMSYRGTAVARLDGQVVFVAGALPGEEILAEVERGRRDYLEARTLEVVTASVERVVPRCTHFGVAGSCEWEFIAYAAQLRLKDEILRGQFRRIGHFDAVATLAAIPSPEPWGYRNHARFVIDAAGNPCYLRRGTHVPVPIESCASLQPWINSALPLLQGRLGGLAGVELRCGVNTGETLIAPLLDGRGIDLPSGQPAYHEELLGRRFRISAGSFFQVNTRVAEELARVLIEALGLQGTERVADLYAGVGTFACLLARNAGAVLGVESAAEAVEDGRLNSGFLENVRYRKGMVDQVLPQLTPPPEVVVLDPPRSGCERGVIASLLAQAPRLIAYVSCDPATLARDARLLVDGGYRLDSLRLVDMFPQTYHIESLAIFARNVGHEP